MIQQQNKIKNCSRTVEFLENKTEESKAVTDRQTDLLSIAEIENNV